MKPAPCTLPLKLRLWAGSRRVRGDKSLSAIAKRWFDIELTTFRKSMSNGPDVDSSLNSNSTSRMSSDIELRKIYKTMSDLKWNLSHTLHGRRNTPRLVAILEHEFNLPIATIRALVEEHKTRLRSGNPISNEEAVMWIKMNKIRDAHPDWTDEQILVELQVRNERIRQAFDRAPGVAA